MPEYINSVSVANRYLFVSADGLVLRVIEFNAYQSKLKAIARLNRMLDFDEQREPIRLYDPNGKCLDFYTQEEIVGKEIVKAIKP